MQNIQDVIFKIIVKKFNKKQVYKLKEIFYGKREKTKKKVQTRQYFLTY